MIDPVMNPDYSQAQRTQGMAQNVAEKVLEVKEPKKTEKSPEGSNNPDRHYKERQSKGKKKHLDLYV